MSNSDFVTSIKRPLRQKPYKVLVDCERMKYPFTGLYYYCLHLKKHLEAASRDKNLCFYIRESNKDLFADSCTLTQHSYHKFFLPSLKDFSVWHSTYQGTMYYPWKQKIKILFTIHDLNFLYDESKPEWKKKKYLAQVAAKIDRADHIVAISNFTLNDVKKHINIDGKSCSVIYNGCTVNEQTTLKTPDAAPSNSFFFTIGTIVPKKNFHVLPALLLKNDFKLVIAGITQDEAYKDLIVSEAKKLGVEDRLVFTGSVNENDKQWYLKNCAAFAFPSISEGFGLPVVEAMYFGKPVLLSNSTSLPEIGGTEAYYFQSFDPDHMNEIATTALNQHNSMKAERIKQWASQFDWSTAAQQYLDLYSKLSEK